MHCALGDSLGTDCSSDRSRSSSSAIGIAASDVPVASDGRSCSHMHCVLGDSLGTDCSSDRSSSSAIGIATSDATVAHSANYWPCPGVDDHPRGVNLGGMRH